MRGLASWRMRIDISQQLALQRAKNRIRSLVVARYKFMRGACVDLRSLRVSVGVQ